LLTQKSILGRCHGAIMLLILHAEQDSRLSSVYNLPWLQIPPRQRGDTKTPLWKILVSEGVDGQFSNWDQRARGGGCSALPPQRWRAAEEGWSNGGASGGAGGFLPEAKGGAPWRRVGFLQGRAWTCLRGGEEVRGGGWGGWGGGEEGGGGRGRGKRGGVWRD
jgi:hypothetical protein